MSAGQPKAVLEDRRMREGSTFEIGDAVRLRVDGSPGMRVEAIEAEGRLVCVWTDGAGNPQSQAFPARSLRPLETDTGPATGEP